MTLGVTIFWFGFTLLVIPILAMPIARLFSKAARAKVSQDDLTDAGCAWMTIAFMLMCAGPIIELAGHIYFK